MPDRPKVAPTRETELLRLVFSGECLPGHEAQAVRDAVVAALKLDDKRAARLFSGKRVVLRRAVDVTKAHRYIARFAALGAVVRAEPASSEAVRTAPAGVAAAGEAGAAGPAAPTPAPTPTPTPSSTAAAAASAMPWAQVLRWIGLAMAGSVAAVLLGLLLGPGLGALWPQAPAPEAPLPKAPPPLQPAFDASPAPALQALAAEAPVTAASAGTGPATAGAGAAPAGADIALPADMSPVAARDYRQFYLPARRHKAFAISSTGLHAWHAGATSADEAHDAALDRCMAALRPGDDGCRIVDADGELLE